MADLERRTKEITNTYTMLDSDSGITLICNKATPFTITMQSPTDRHFFDVMIVNIGAGIVTVGGQTVGQYSHAHITNLAGTTWVVAIGGGAETDPVYLASASAGVVKTAYDHSQAAHAPSNAQKNSDMIKGEVESVLTGTITSHGHDGALPTGGTTNQLAAKNSNSNFDMKWMDAPAAANGIPTGGTINQLPAKASNADFDMIWVDAPAAANGMPTGGMANQIPSKIDGTDFNVQWVDPPTGGGGSSVWGGM